MAKANESKHESQNVDQNGEAAAPALRIKSRKVLTVPTISLKSAGTKCYIKVSSKMEIGKQLKADKENEAKTGTKKEPAIICKVINLETGEDAQIIVPSMLKGMWDDDYPNDSYVGKAFYIENKGKIEKAGSGGQQYNKIYIEELELEDE